MSQQLRVLILEASEDNMRSLLHNIQKGGYDPVSQRVETIAELEQALGQTWDIIIADHALPHCNAFDALKCLQEKNLDIPFILVAGKIGAELVADLLKAGAHDYVLKGNSERLIPSIARELEATSIRQEQKRVARQLRINKSRYRIISELFSDYAYVFRVEPDGTLVNEWITDAFFTVTGFTIEELETQEGWRKLVHPDDMSVALERRDRLLQGLPDTSEFRIITREGRIRWVREHSKSLPDEEQPEVLYIYSVAQDITEHKQAQEALLHSEERFAKIFHCSPLPVAVVTMAEGRILDVNQSFLTLADCQREDVINHTFNESTFLVHPVEQAYIVQQLNQQHAIHGMELTFRTCQGNTRSLLAWMEVIELQQETCILAILHDITERKQNEEALRKERDFINAILDTEGSLVIVLDPQGNIVRFNRACERLSGYESPEVKGQQFLNLLIPQEEQERAASLFNHLKTGKYPKTYEGDWLTRQGNRCRIAWSNTVLLDDQGNVEYLIGTGLDITEHRKAEERIQRQIQRLSALRRIQMDISAHLDQHITMTLLLEHVITLMNVDAATVLLLPPHSQTLEYVVGKGFHTTGIQWSRLRMGEGCAGRVALERRALVIADVQQPGSCCVRRHLLRREGFVSYYGVPLISKGQVKGVLELFHSTPISLDKESQDFLDALAGHTAIVIDNAELFENLQRSKDELTIAYDRLQQSKDELTSAYNATIEGWAHALELRDAETEGHSRRVTDMTLRLARAMGCDENHMVHIYRGAILHDIGKMAIPDSILLKPGPLTEEEWDVMRQHPVYAYQLLKPIGFLKPALKIPYYHHEKWDGTGYPNGLKEDAIPLEARIFAVVDVWDALSTDRPYRNAWSPERVCDYLREYAGTHFDPQVVQMFLTKILECNESSSGTGGESKK